MEVKDGKSVGHKGRISENSTRRYDERGKKSEKMCRCGSQTKEDEYNEQEMNKKKRKDTTRVAMKDSSSFAQAIQRVAVFRVFKEKITQKKELTCRVVVDDGLRGVSYRVHDKESD